VLARVQARCGKGTEDEGKLREDSRAAQQGDAESYATGSSGVEAGEAREAES